jgi:hypothetical protein
MRLLNHLFRICDMWVYLCLICGKYVIREKQVESFTQIMLIF